jgi:hypothetical protein
MSKKLQTLNVTYDNKASELVKKLEAIENKMKETTSLAGLKKLHNEVVGIQKELGFVTEVMANIA